LNKKTIDSNFNKFSVLKNEFCHKISDLKTESTNFEKIYIDDDQSLKSLFKKLKQNYSYFEIKHILENLKINFEIVRNIKYEKGTNLSIMPEYNDEPLEKKERKLTDINLFDNINEIIDTCNKLNKNEIIIPIEIIFKKFYSEKILRNPALYCVKKATEYFYLISIFYLATIEFSELFKIENTRFFKLDDFENKKINNLLSKQVSDYNSIFLKTIPKWCGSISLNFPFLANFHSRNLYFKTCTFDYKRNLNNLFLYYKKEQGESNSFEKIVGHNRRRKIMIDRQKIMQSVQKIIDINKNFHVSFFHLLSIINPYSF